MKLWIGGSSGLAQTYFNTFAKRGTVISGRRNHHRQRGRAGVGGPNRDDEAAEDDESWILLGCERTLPDWILQLQQQQQDPGHCNYHYIYCDFHQLEDSDLQRVWDDIHLTVRRSSSHSHSTTIDSVVIGIRPPLVTYRTNSDAFRYNNSVVDGLHRFLQSLLSPPPSLLSQDAATTNIRLVVHISSIAAIDHIATQHLRSIRRNSNGARDVTTPTKNNPNNSNNSNRVQKPQPQQPQPDDPSYTELQYPYDRFKRQCEMMIEQLVQEINRNNHNINQNHHDDHHTILYTSLRLGAIFSDSPHCIQCSALWLQYLFGGPYLSTPIDCNSSYNVSQLIHEILLSFAPVTTSTTAATTTTSNTTTTIKSLRPVYYYTRCVSQYPYPVPYGEHFLSYRNVHGTPIGSSILPILVPQILIEYGVVRLLHVITLFLQWVQSHCRRMTMWFSSLSSSSSPWSMVPPYLESMDYLLQVTVREHTFDMTETIADFPNVLRVEETVDECFRRRRRLQQQRRL